MKRLGVIGTGGQAALWARAASTTPGWSTAACYHPRPSRHLPGVSYRQTDDLEDLLSSSDVVVISSPTPTHLGYLTALSRRYRGTVIVEKPVVGTLEECRRLVRLVPSYFLRRIIVAHNWRFQPWVEKTRRILCKAEDRRVIAAEFHLTHDFAYKVGYAGSWRSHRSFHPLGPMETQGIHWIDLVHLLFGPVAWAAGCASNLARTGTAPDTSSLFLRTRNGVSCSIHTSYAAPLAHHARILTPSSILTYRNGTLILQRRQVPPPRGTSRPPMERIVCRNALRQLSLETLRSQLRALRLSGGPSVATGFATCLQGMANVAVLAAFGKSVQSGRPVSMDRIPVYADWVRDRLPRSC